MVLVTIGAHVQLRTCADILSKVAPISSSSSWKNFSPRIIVICFMRSSKCSSGSTWMRFRAPRTAPFRSDKRSSAVAGLPPSSRKMKTVKVTRKTCKSARCSFKKTSAGSIIFRTPLSHSPPAIFRRVEFLSPVDSTVFSLAPSQESASLCGHYRPVTLLWLPLSQGRK